jgi:two-component system sensor histidine kinase VicK
MQKTIIEKKELSNRKLASTGGLTPDEKLALLAAIVESSEDAIVSKTLDGIITSWNSGAERMFGYTPAEIIGLPITILIPFDRLDEEPKIIEQLKKGERVDHFETRRRTKEGRLIDISLTISPVRDSDGNIIGASKIARDITHIKALERRKDDFIHMASHELKTPITSIKGYMQLASQIISGKEFEPLRQEFPHLDVSMKAVNKQVDKMISLISELLDLSRIEFGKLQITRSEFNLEEMVQETIRDLRPTTTRHEISFESSFSGDVSADRDRLSQALINLLTNAIKYSPEAGQVEVKLRSEENFAEISVRDYGIGIEPKDHRLIFERFFRVEGKNEKTFPGFGIGLYVTAEIIELHGGQIQVESEKGKGARFTIRIPISDKLK